MRIYKYKEVSKKDRDLFIYIPKPRFLLLGFFELFFLLLLSLRCINRKNGHNTIRVDVQGTTEKSWHLKCEHISKQYTTNFGDVITVK